MLLTLENASKMLATDLIINLRHIYSWRSPKYWALLQPITVKLSTGLVITIPEGFETDLSSSPRYLWSVEPPFGDFLLAALIHDYLYVYNIGTRKGADREMLYWSNAINKNKTDNRIRYWAVRLFGASWWNS